MKTLQSLTQQLEQWRRVCVLLVPRQISSHPGLETSGQAGRLDVAKPNHQPHAVEATVVGALPSESSNLPSEKADFLRRPPSPQSPMNSTGRSPVSLILAVLCLTAAIGQRFYNQPQLAVGTIAPQDFLAPEYASVEDTKTTVEKRRDARIGSTPLLMIDRPVTEQIYKVLKRSLQEGDHLREIAGPFPFANTSVLSTLTQLYLRESQAWQWLAVLAVSKQDSTQANLSPSRPSSAPPNRTLARTSLLTPAGQQAVQQLQAYRKKASPQEFSALLEKISQARQGYAKAVRALSSASIIAEAGPLYDLRVLNLTERDWQQTKTGILNAAKRILDQGIPPGLPNNILQNAANSQVRVGVPHSTQQLASEVLLAVLTPNLTKDLERTRIRAEQAAKEVQAVVVTVHKGELIVEEGQEIAQAHFVLLDHFGMSRRQVNWLGLVGFGGCVTLFVGIFWLVERRSRPRLRRRDRILILLLTLSPPLLVTLGVPSTSLPAVGLLVGSFYGSAIGGTVVGLLTMLLPVGMDIEWTHLIASFTGAMVCGLMAQKMRSREELAFLGVAVALTQGSVYLMLNLILSAAAGPVWYTVLSAAFFQSLAGLAWSIVALGVSPYLEHVFDLIATIRLAELSNPNRPLLKQLASVAPGTFQHTLFVSTLAEAAARELGCNVELVRAGTLYHDIGKMHDPLGFIENQMGGPNKHDELNDPWKSADIIKKHVSEGLVMARKYRLPKAIQAFIPEHQGTMLIAYFYYQAQQQAGEGSKPVREEDFRYDGPIPQSRETAIVMLADSCEAALRSLKDATTEEALSMVNKILRARWQDNQLTDCGLKRAEMAKIAEIFVQVWQQFHHKRIAYPKAALSPQPSKF